MAKVVKSRDPVAFFSYVRLVDEHEGGRLTEFRKRLSNEVEIHAGTPFPIFQDRNDIEWGQQWKERIEESIDAVTFLIPIVTPNFFESPACRDELETFLEREEKLERNDLILPVYYVDCPVLNDEEKRRADPLAEVIASRQRVDWRDLRFDPMTSPQVGKKLAQMAVQVRDALERSAPRREAAKPKPSRARGKGKSSAAHDDSFGATASVETSSQAEIDREQKRRGPVTKSEPPTHVVDPMAREDFTTISDALAAANPGDRILVRPGLYEEGLVIDMPIEIIGDGERDEIVVRASGTHCVRFEANMGRIVNFTLQQMGDGDWYGVDIARGRLELEDCDITSQSLSCVAIHEGADPRLRRNRIHDGKAGGVFVYEKGQGTLEDNDIFGNASAGVVISEGGDPTLRRNRIHDGKAGGVFVYEEGQGTLEDNDIFGNAYSGVEIKEGGDPTLRRNRIHDGKQSGVYVREEGQGTLEDNDIFGNAYHGVEIKEGGNPTLRRNKINNNGYRGIRVYDNGGGTFEDNDLTGNTRGAWDISKDSEKNVERSGNKE